MENFIEKYQIVCGIQRVSHRDDLVWDSQPGQSHWRYEFRTLTNDSTVSGFFSQGSACKDSPTTGEILSCLAMDASCVLNCVDVLDFAYEMGYTTEDHERARLVFKACEDTHSQLLGMLGEDGLEELFELDLED